MSTAKNLDRENLSIGPLDQIAASISVKRPDVDDNTLTIPGSVANRAS